MGLIQNRTANNDKQYEENKEEPADLHNLALFTSGDLHKFQV
ncbi:hypothetical protein FHS14_004030 [Paenibacillus baekrokdamisoli]|nr:hypothetical protein [Paenibacillus baekrokdamisoli]